MKKSIVCFVIAVIFFNVVNSEREKCVKCIPKDMCEMYGEMSKKEQDNWVVEHPCQNLEEEDSASVFGFAQVAKGDLVCCPYSNIWGVESPTTTTRENLTSRFGDGNDGSRYPHSRETYTDDGYNQDNLHKKQNSNLNRDDNENENVSYEKQRYSGNSRPRNYGRQNNVMNQPYIQGNGNYRFPTFGANGIPNYYDQPNSRPSGNNFNRPDNRFVNNYDQPKNNLYDPSPSPTTKQCSISILPPDSRESDCCGLDLAGERMYSAQQNYVNRPGNSNYGSPSWSNSNRRFTRATPEEVGISLDSRIAGGKETDLYQFPWTVLLKTTFDYGNNKKGTFNCGGSLISSRYVLTAAHCVTEPNSVISNIDVYLAEYDKRTFPRDCMNSPEGRKCIDNILTHAEAVYAHPYYDDAKLQSDIALIRLQDNIVPYTDYTRPICLPPINIDNPEYSNLRLAVAGWGRNGSVPSDVKQSTVVNLVPQRECSRSYPSLTKQHVCAAGRTGEDTCKGDSGGPLMMLYQGKYYVSGVVSGKRADAPCGTAVPSLYTNVYQFLPWIHQTIRN